jgi:outer membrane protein TolC
MKKSLLHSGKIFHLGRRGLMIGLWAALIVPGLFGLTSAAEVNNKNSNITVLTLDRALQIALEKNKDIKKAREYRNQVQGRYVEERAAALPQLVGQTGISRAHDESQRAAFSNIHIPGFTLSTPVEVETRNAMVGLSQLVYSFGQVEAAIRAAKVGLKTADDQLLLYQQAALKEVSSAFYDVLLSRELYALAQQNLEQKNRHLEEARKKYAAGTATDYDVLAGEVAVQNARPDVVRTENTIRISRENLRFLLGLDSEVDAQGTLSTTIGAYPVYTESISTAWEHRPELTGIKHQIGVAEELLSLAKAGNLPIINLKAGYGWQSLDYSPGQADGPLWTVGLFATFPFFDGFRTQGKVAQAKSNVSSLKIDEAKLVDSIVLQTRQAVDAVKEAGEIVKGLSGTVDQAQRLLSMAEKGYEYGVKTRLDVDDAELNLMLAQSNLAKARRDYIVANINLQWVMGVLKSPGSSSSVSMK